MCLHSFNFNLYCDDKILEILDFDSVYADCLNQMISLAGRNLSDIVEMILETGIFKVDKYLT